MQKNLYKENRSNSSTRFLSSPITIRVHFFLLLGFNKGTLKKGQKGTTQEPSQSPESLIPTDQSGLQP